MSILSESIRYEVRNDVVLNEAMFSSVSAIFSSGINKYQFKFMEKGEHKFVFIKNSGNFYIAEFDKDKRGNTYPVNSEAELDLFIDDMKSQGYKLRTKDGDIMTILKWIGRKIGKALITGGVISIGFAVLFALLIASGIIMVSTMTAFALTGFTLITGGWILSSVSKKDGV